MRNQCRQSGWVSTATNAVIGLTLIAICSFTVSAQSGRRVSKSKAAPIPTPEVPAEEKKPTEELKPAFTFILTSDKHEAFGQVPSYFHDSVLRACADRLDDSPSVRVEIAYRDMNRGEAIRRAKAEKEAFVVWMQLRTDSGSIGREDLSELYLDFWVFAPTTAKVKLSGRSYQGSYGVGGVITSPRNRASLPHAELMLKQAAREAAEKILAAVRDQPAGAPVPGLVNLETARCRNLQVGKPCSRY